MKKKQHDFVTPTPVLRYSAAPTSRPTLSQKSIRTSNVQRPTSNFERKRNSLARGHFDVRRSAFDVQRSHLIRNSVLTFLAAISILLVTGCQTVPAQTHRAVDPGVALPTDRPATDEEAVASDPCAIRLGHLIECMMQYYMLNKQMPQSLDELKPFAEVGSPLQLVCTATGQPYQYYPSGLMSAGRSKRIIVYDPTPAHHGSRWCIMMPYTAPGAAMSLEVVAVPEADFSTYVPSIQ
jgi:hypothetical protein